MDTYCKVFVQGVTDRNGLIQLVAQILEGQVERRTVEGSGLSVDVNKNEYCDPQAASRGDEQFINFPFYLDLEPIGGIKSDESYIAGVEFFLDGLRAAGQTFVTACDFEDELRDKGASPPRQSRPN